MRGDVSLDRLGSRLSVSRVPGLTYDRGSGGCWNRKLGDDAAVRYCGQRNAASFPVLPDCGKKTKKPSYVRGTCSSRTVRAEFPRVKGAGN